MHSSRRVERHAVRRLVVSIVTDNSVVASGGFLGGLETAARRMGEPVLFGFALALHGILLPQSLSTRSFLPPAVSEPETSPPAFRPRLIFRILVLADADPFALP